MAVHIQTTSLDGALAAFREGEVKLLTEIATALAEFKEADEDRRRLLDIAQDLREMFFLVVVIGEFNAGKSSFINALLGDELLAMGITPTTDAIHVIRYNENSPRKANIREDGIYEWTHPNTIATGVALVDTPGTGSVFQKHEKIAKQFLHRSDLVIFVISAKRAFAETERLYLELAKNYGKKIILVVNQTDLLNPNELREVRTFVERQAKELLDFEPLIFLVSAKDALQARRNGQPDAGGIDAVKAHLRGVLSEAPPAKQKLLAQLDTAERTVKHYYDAAKSKYDLIGADTTKVRDIQRELETQSGGLNAQLTRARADIDAVFEGMRMRGLEFINKNLSLRSIGRGLNRETLQAQFTETVVGQATRDIETATGDYINVLIDNSRQYWRGVINRLNQLRDLMEQEVGGLDAGMYAEQREALEDAIRIAESELKSYSTGRVIGEMQEVFATNTNGFLLGFSAAVIGMLVTILAIAAPGPVVGLAAAATIVAAPAAALGGYVAYRYYRRVARDTKDDMNKRIDAIEKAYHDALDNLTRKERSRLNEYGKQVLTPIFSRLQVLSERYEAQAEGFRKYLDQSTTLRRGIEELK
ncbi:MAG: dynamin family protein [Anaerolineae bacterium]|nr:dynamin family protein [Anaerolineae bacterium]